MPLHDVVPEDKYRAYRRMNAPPAPSDPIDPFFRGIPKPAHPIERNRYNSDYPPTLDMEEFWTGSLVSESSSLSSSGPSRRSRIPGLLEELNAGTCRFRLRYPLSRGKDRWAQTWVGGILLSCGTMAAAVIKVFQESRFPPSDDDDDDSDVEEQEKDGSRNHHAKKNREDLFSRAARYASAEAYAYVKLQELQGKDVPWSYGFYKFSIIDGIREVSYAHVMEYIPLPSAEEMIQSHQYFGQPLLGSITHDKMLDALVEGLGKLHKHGICHNDITLGNFIVYEQAGELSLILLDFAFSRPVSSWGIYNDGEALLGCIRTPLRIQEWDVGRRLDEKAGSGTYYEVLFENVWLEREAPADYMDVYNLV